MARIKIGFISKKSPFIASDQRFGLDRIMQMGRGETEFPTNPFGLHIQPSRTLVAKIPSASLFGQAGPGNDLSGGVLGHSFRDPFKDLLLEIFSTKASLKRQKGFKTGNLLIDMNSNKLQKAAPVN